MSTLAAAISSGKAIIDLVKLIDGARLDAAGQEAVRELNTVLLSHQSDMLSLSEKLQEQQAEITALKERIAKQDEWSEIATHYSLDEITDGVFAYSNDIHDACPVCFQNKFISIIQKKQWSYAGTTYACMKAGCEFEYLDSSTSKPRKRRRRATGVHGGL